MVCVCRTETSKAKKKNVQLLFDCYNWMDLINNQNAIYIYPMPLFKIVQTDINTKSTFSFVEYSCWEKHFTTLLNVLVYCWWNARGLYSVCMKNLCPKQNFNNKKKVISLWVYGPSHFIYTTNGN